MGKTAKKIGSGGQQNKNNIICVANTEETPAIYNLL